MLTVPEAARRVGKNPETVRRWIRAGKLPAIRIGTQHVIDEDDLALVLAGVTGRPSSTAGGAPMVDWTSVVRWSRVERAARLSEAVAPYLSGVAARPDAGGVEDPWLPAIVGRIVRLVDPTRIILFGSRARGTARPGSDYDLLVVLDAVSDRRATAIAVRRVLEDLPISKDVVVASNDEATGVAGRPRGVLHWALSEGQVIYERG